MPDTDEIMPSKQFQRRATEFIELIDHRELFSRPEFVRRVHDLLVDLYRLGGSLPHVGTISAERDTVERCSHEDWYQIYAGVRRYLGDANVYWSVFDPADSEGGQADQTELSNDLAEIYQDLKNSLPLDQAIEMSSNAIWELKAGFEHHWGHHIISALTVLHSFIYGPSYLLNE